MLAAITHAAADIRLEEVPDPIPGPGIAVLRVGSVGLCGTDLHMYAGERADTGFPLRQGHEIGGIVAALPTNYRGDLRLEQRVAVDPSAPCGRCRACERGSWASCGSFEAIGVARPGGLAEYVAVPVTQLHDASVLTDEEAALVEPFSIAEMALHRAQLRGGERLFVAGAGPIGLALTISAAARGIPVMVTDPMSYRRELARELGADRVVEPGTGLLAGAIADWTRGDGVDVALEASGSPAALADCLSALGRAGRLVIVGVAAHDLVMPVPKLLFEGISVVGARAGLFPQALTTVAAQRHKAGRLITHRLPLAQVAHAFALASDPVAESIKVVVTC